MKGFIDAIRQGRKGLVFGNSLFLPFRLDLMSIWVGKEMSLLSSPEVILDLCEGSRDVGIREEDGWTNIVLRRHGDLARDLGNGKGHVILYGAEKGADLFMQDQRHYIRVSIPAKGKETSFEVVDDPFKL
jgi:hypothetical protein